MGKGGI